MIQKNTILFDLDGTLIESAPGIGESINEALAELGYPTRTAEDIPQFVGPPLEESFRKLLSTSDEALVTKAVALYRSHYRDRGLFKSKLYADVSDVLAELDSKGCVMYIVTSKRTEFAEAIMRHLGMSDLFRVICGSSPDGLHDDKRVQTADFIRAQAIAPETALFVGDRKQDIRAAHANAITAAGALWGYAEPDELRDADYLLTTIRELPATLARINLR